MAVQNPPSPRGTADLGMVRKESRKFASVLLPDQDPTWAKCTGTQMAPGSVQIWFPSSEPSHTDAVQRQGG